MSVRSRSIHLHAWHIKSIHLKGPYITLTCKKTRPDGWGLHECTSQAIIFDIFWLYDTTANWRRADWKTIPSHRPNIYTTLIYIEHDKDSKTPHIRLHTRVCHNRAENLLHTTEMQIRKAPFNQNSYPTYCTCESLWLRYLQPFRISPAFLSRFY